MLRANFTLNLRYKEEGRYRTFPSLIVTLYPNITLYPASLNTLMICQVASNILLISFFIVFITKQIQTSKKKFQIQKYMKKCMSLPQSHPQFHSWEVITITILMCVLPGFFFFLTYVSIYTFEGDLIFFTNGTTLFILFSLLQCYIP